MPLDGFYAMSDADYRAAPGLNWSRLKVVGESPALYHHRQSHPRPDTPAMALGRALHARVLQPEVFAADYKLCTRYKRGTDAWDRYAAMWEGYEIISEDEQALVERMAERLHAHKHAAALLAMPSEREQAAFWTEGGVAMKAKIDLRAWAPGHEASATEPLVVVDLKTTRDVDPEQFSRSADRFGYVGQMAHYGRGVEILTGRRVIPVLVCVESAEPFDVGVFRLPYEVYKRGGLWREKLLSRLDTCEAQGSWPGKVPEVIDLPVPRWSKLPYLD